MIRLNRDREWWTLAAVLVAVAVIALEIVVGVIR